MDSQKGNIQDIRVTKGAIPQPPECRVEYRGWDGAFIGPKSEFIAWKALPLWKRILGFKK